MRTLRGCVLIYPFSCLLVLFVSGYICQSKVFLSSKIFSHRPECIYYKKNEFWQFSLAKHKINILVERLYEQCKCIVSELNSSPRVLKYRLLHIVNYKINKFPWTLLATSRKMD